MSVDSAGFRFVSHQRSGLIALPGVAATGTLQASATLSDGSTTTPVTMALPSLGDVQGLDLRLLSRQYPRPGATDVETEFFPLVELSVPELPWLLPAPAGPAGPLPWLCLVAVEQRDGVSLTRSSIGLPDVLHIEGPAKPSDELPDPASSALWAHAFAATTAHTVGDADATDGAGNPSPSGCRLIAPRRLQPQTSYLACLVPVFAASALAGLGHPDADIAAALAASPPAFAWSASADSVDLPVYLSWQFSCGAAGDFESLARSLKEVPVGPTFGTRPLDIGLAGAGMPQTTTLATVFRGALTAPGIADESSWPASSDHDQVAADAALTKEIAAAAALTKTGVAGGHPVVGPLLYARAAAGRDSVGAEKPAKGWFDQLNRDPRARAPGGLGTRVLRRGVESVMARAWAQVGEVDAANAALRRLQMSRAVSASLHVRHLSAFSPGTLLSAARPVLGRVRIAEAATGGVATADALAAVAASALPAGTTWRGVNVAVRPGGGLGTAATGADARGRVVAGLASGLAEPQILPDGTVGLAAPSAVLGANAAGLVSDGLRAAAAAAGLAAPAAGADPSTAVQQLDTLVSAASGLSSAAATKLGALTAATVTAHPLPKTASFTRFAATGIGHVIAHGFTHEVGHAAIHPGPAAGHLAAGAGAEASLGGASVAEAPPAPVVLTKTDPRLAEMREAYAVAAGLFVQPGASTPLPAPAALDLDGARTSLLAGLDPAATVAALAAGRIPALSGLSRPDPIAPVMVGPVFAEGAYTGLVEASHDAFVPALDSIPADSVTLLETNPTFIAAYMAGLNSALGHELLWRGYPTDERGTYWYSFWGAGPDIGPLTGFSGDLADNITAGTQPLLVLVLRGRLLRRYPDSDIYAVEAGTDDTHGELDDPTKIVRPLFRDFVDPDMTLVGFPLTYDDVVGNTGPGYWFVIAEHPGQPRFGLTDPDPTDTHPPLPSWDELSWNDLGATAASATYLPAAAPEMAPAGTTRQWGGSAADMAAITYQPAVRVAIRANDLLAPPAS